MGAEAQHHVATQLLNHLHANPHQQAPGSPQGLAGAMLPQHQSGGHHGHGHAHQQQLADSPGQLSSFGSSLNSSPMQPNAAAGGSAAINMRPPPITLRAKNALAGGVALSFAMSYTHNVSTEYKYN